MDNVLEGILAEGTTATNEDVETEETTQDYDHSYDLTENDFGQEETEESTQEVNEEESDDVNVQDTPTNQAFAQMRTQNKELSQKLSELDELAKSLGMKDSSEFLAKAKEAQAQKEAKDKGIPVEVAQELQEMRDLKDSILAERQQNVRAEKEKTFASNVHDFVKANNLSKSSVDKLSQDLERDGLPVEMLMAMPKAALNRVLSSYVGTNYQKNLERKEKAINELPINQSSKIDIESVNKTIDEFARQLAGK